MKLFGTLALTLAVLGSTDVRAQHNIYTYRLKPQQYQTLRNDNQSLRPHHFGLTNVQKQRIFKLTKGKVDFRGIYESRKKLKLRNITLKKNQFLGKVGFAKPPVLMSPVLAQGDPLFSDLWWVNELKVHPAWDLATGKGVHIADCDAGYYIEENDLEENLLIEHRYDLADLDDPFQVRDGNFTYHGTAVSAIMSGVLDGQGTNGIAFDSKVVPLQNFNYDSSLDDLNKEEATAKCILHALKIPSVRIIVLENQTAEGSSETYAGTREAVKLALGSGVTIVSAAGNYQKELKIEEMYDTGSIIVGALEPNGQQASFSNYGKRVSIAAFGRDLLTLYGPDGKFGKFGGTSGATPQVAAAVALMLEANSNLIPSDVKKILEKTRITHEENKRVGGQLDIFAAVLAARDYPASFQKRRRLHQNRRNVVRILNQN